MKTIQIDNVEFENFISSQYGDDKTTLVSDFIKFMRRKI